MCRTANIKDVETTWREIREAVSEFYENKLKSTKIAGIKCWMIDEILQRMDLVTYKNKNSYKYCEIRQQIKSKLRTAKEKWSAAQYEEIEQNSIPSTCTRKSSKQQELIRRALQNNKAHGGGTWKVYFWTTIITGYCGSTRHNKNRSRKDISVLKNRKTSRLRWYTRRNTQIVERR